MSLFTVVDITRLALLSILGCFIISCSATDHDTQLCPEPGAVLDDLRIEGGSYILTKSGEIFTKNSEGCVFYSNYFDPDFLSKNYKYFEGGVYATDGKSTIKTISEFYDDFESTSKFINLFILDSTNLNRNWLDFTLQSPANPTVKQYVDLRNCMKQNKCDFDDNTISIEQNGSSNHGNYIKFFSEAPSPDMVTSKSSIENTLLYAEANDSVFFDCDLFVEKGLPYSFFDLENKWFEGSPGIRVILDENQSLALELKYGEKPKYSQKANQMIRFPTNAWVHLSVSYYLRADNLGAATIYQDGLKVLEIQGKTLPTSNSIQTNLEIGITASGTQTILLMDNVHVKIKKN